MSDTPTDLPGSTPEGADRPSAEDANGTPIEASEAAERVITLVDPIDEGEADLITQVDLNQEMQRSFLDYAMSVIDRKSTRLNSSHSGESRMPSSA